MHALRLVGWLLVMLVAFAEPARAEMVRSSGVAVARQPPPHPPRPNFLTAEELRTTLERARPDLTSCLTPASQRASVRVTLHQRRGLNVRVQVTPRNETVRQCLDTAARRWTTLLESRPLQTTSITASIRVASNSIAPPPPPPPNNNTYDEAHVHAALDRQRTEILRCVPRLSPGIPGSIVLRASVRPDGSVMLEGATLPSGLGDPNALVCLGELVSRVRVPAPSAVRSVTHTVQLGR
jgi:hypothetical protein